MNSSDLLQLFRDEMQDVAAPYFWSDEEIFGYVDDAQTMFCRKTDGILDATTPEVTELSIVVGDEWVAIHPKIRRILSAERTDTGRDIDVVKRAELRSQGWRFDGRTGQVRGIVIGMEAHKVRLFPISDEDVTLALSVYRLPLVKITDVGDQALEVDEEHHRHLVLWMQHLAYLKHDAETFNKVKAQDFEDRFLRYCASVTREENKKAYRTGVVEYGGI